MYSTQQDLIDRFGEEELQRYAWDEDTDTANESRIQQAINDAQETVNIYIAATVRLPLATTPPILTALSADIARYRLQDDNPLDEATERYKTAIRVLKDIAAGRATLGTVEQGTTGATVEAQRGINDRLFTRESLADF